MQIKCVVIDDEPFAIELLKDYIGRCPVLKLVNSFEDGVAAIDYLNTVEMDLIFMDIDMPDISGIDLYRSLKLKPTTIFTTAYKKFAVDGFDLDILDYLLKPFSFERFHKSVYKAVEYFDYLNYCKNKQHDSLVVRSEYKLLKIDLSSIEYIESVEDYCKIYLETGNPVLTLMTLRSLLEKLPGNKFKRIHRSYIAPIDKVRAVSNRHVQLTSKELPISDSYIGFVKEWLRK